MAPITISLVFPEKEVKRAHSFEEALELAGFGRAQLILVILAGSSMMASINEAMGLSIILPASDCDLLLDPGEKGLIGGAIFLGIMASSYFWGYQADTRGRQLVLKYALFATSVCSVASSFVNDFGSLMALRFITGVCISAPSAIVYTYLGEFCTNSKRVQMLSYASVMASLGIVYVALIGWWILSYSWSFAITDTISFKPWRLLFIVYTVPGFVAAIAYCFCPESPKFLLTQGRTGEALDVLRRLYRVNKGLSSDEGYEVTALVPETVQNDKQVKGGFREILQSMKDQTVPLLKAPYLVYFLVCGINSISAFAIYGGLGLWFPQIMNQVFSDGSSAAVCSILETKPSADDLSQVYQCTETVKSETFMYTIMLGLMGMSYCFILSLILGRISGKTMMIINMAVAGVAGIALQFVSNSYVVAVLFCVEIMFAGMCVMLVNALAVSLFPTHVRGMAVSLVNMAGRFSCFVGSAVIGLLMAQNCPLTFYALSGLLFVSSVAALLLPW
uniref:Synaptic vesicle glycoprotein 2B n=1 Tax=Culex pipiens TaxID=7175 RepID=A0A8D8EB46_CULPI